jgi:hypothetical protein
LINVFGIGGTYTFSPTFVLDANIGYTRQRLGAEGFDIVSNFGLDVLRIPGTNGPDHLQGGVPAFQINGGWTNIGNDNTGNPFLFRDNQYVAAANLSWLKGTHSFRFGAAAQSLPTPGRSFSDGARKFRFQRHRDTPARKRSQQR